MIKYKHIKKDKVSSCNEEVPAFNDKLSSSNEELSAYDDNYISAYIFINHV